MKADMERLQTDPADEAPDDVRLPPFAALRAFEAVFRIGGIRRAAAHLGLSHAVVSRHIKQLEDWFGHPLVSRQGNRLVLSEEGRSYHSRVSAAFADLRLATREFEGLYNCNHLRLWCSPGLSIQWLSAQLARFEELHPEFSIELKPADTPPDLLTYEADVDVRYLRDTQPFRISKSLRRFDLARPEVMAIARPDIAERLNNMLPADILEHTQLLHEENHLEWRTWLEANDIPVPGELSGSLCWHAHLAIAAARQGRGVALATRFLVD